MKDNNTPDLSIPGVIYTLEPDDADSLGAFEEEALSEQDALDTQLDEHEEVENAHG